MRKWTFTVCLAVWGAGLATASIALAEATSQPASQQTTQPTTTQAASEADAIKATADKAAAGILEALALGDPAKEAKVRAVMTAFYVKRIAWEPNDDKIKELERQLAKAPKDSAEAGAKELQTELKALDDELARMREALLADLGKVLSSGQIETVKDKMTYGRAKLLYNDITAKHDLSEEQKARVAALLTAAREQAMIAGSAADKHRLFNQALAQVNAYLATQPARIAPAAAPVPTTQPANP